MKNAINPNEKVLTPEGEKEVFKISKDDFVLCSDGTFYHASKVNKVGNENNNHEKEKELIVKLMNKKNAKIIRTASERIGTTKGLPAYFTHNDEKLLRKFWTKEDAQYVLENLKDTLKHRPRFLSLNDLTCPYCIVNDFICNTCMYGKVHGICNYDRNNDYDKIKRKLVGSVDFYQEINSIIKKYDEYNSSTKISKESKSSPIKIYENGSLLDFRGQKYLKLNQDNNGEITLDLVYMNNKYIKTLAKIEYDETGYGDPYVNIITREYLK